MGRGVVSLNLKFFKMYFNLDLYKKIISSQEGGQINVDAAFGVVEVIYNH